MEEVWQNLGVNKEELDSLDKEMKGLRQRARLLDLYHHQMEEFDNLTMEYAFMKAKLLFYHIEVRKVKLNNGSSIRSKLMRLFNRHLSRI